jgi:type VI secretion system protein ImpC
MMGTKKKTEKAAEAVVEEKGLLDDLFDKVDMTVPAGPELDTASGRMSQALNQMIHAVVRSGEAVERVDKTLLDGMIAELDTKISAQVDEVMHHENFQKMESAWRGLKFLVDRTDFRRNTKLEILNVSKDDLMGDFEDVPEPYQSGLFNHVYKQEYDTPGGEPIAGIIANYEFRNHPQDMSLLNNVSKIAAGCHAPFIASVGHEFLGLKSIGDLPQLPDVAPLFDTPEFAKWRAFRDTEDSRYVGLTLPRFLLRLPYGEATKPAKSFNYNEKVSGEEHEKYLWGNASFAFATCLTRSFADHGWCVNIRGPQAGGTVEDLPLHHYQAAGDTVTKIPTEVLMTERREFELAELGFIPFSFYKNRDYACFFSANSCQKPKKYIDPDSTANSRLSARLPYLFLVSRLSHYLKVIQRENIGAAKEKDDLQLELEEWLNQYVTEDKSPSVAAKAKYPLSMAKLEVTDIADNPGFYNVEMLVRPHFQVEGIDVTLSLVSRLPKGKSE